MVARGIAVGLGFVLTGCSPGTLIDPNESTDGADGGNDDSNVSGGYDPGDGINDAAFGPCGDYETSCLADEQCVELGDGVVCAPACGDDAGTCPGGAGTGEATCEAIPPGAEMGCFIACFDPGGSGCPPGMTCVELDAGLAVCAWPPAPPATACVPLAGDCDSGDTCHLEGDEWLCRPYGTAQPGEDCTASDRCDVGLVCDAGICRRLCAEPEVPCEGGVACELIYEEGTAQPPFDTIGLCAL